MEIVEKNDRETAVEDEASPDRLVPRRYALALYRSSGPRLLQAPLMTGEETLPLFSSREAAWSFIVSNSLGSEWRVRECSVGELVSLLLTIHADVEWVLNDSASRDALPNLMRRESFVDYLLKG